MFVDFGGISGFGLVSKILSALELGRRRGEQKRRSGGGGYVVVFTVVAHIHQRRLFRQPQSVVAHNVTLTPLEVGEHKWHNGEIMMQRVIILRPEDIDTAHSFSSALGGGCGVAEWEVSKRRGRHWRCV